VSAGLGLDGGGTAHVGRLYARATATAAAARGLPCEVLSLRGGEGLVPGVGIRDFGGAQLRLAAAVLRRQVLGRVGAVFFDHPGPARVQTLVPARRRAAYGVLVHGIDVWGRLSRQRSAALRGARLLLSHSTYARARAARLHPWLAAAEVLHPCLEPVPEGPPDVALLDRLGHGYVLIVGRMSSTERYKGHDLLLDAQGRMPSSVPCRLVVAGGGDDRARLEGIVRTRGLTGVTFTGFVDPPTLHALFERCAVFAMPSRDEGFGLVYLEAMRAGRPCVAALGSAAEEIVAAGETGLLVPPDDAGALAEALQRLLVDPSLACRMGEAGRRRWTAHFGAERFENGVAEQVDRLLARNG
jgi:phosphatidylinositol alpha-1,6-mannosyltransferase